MIDITIKVLKVIAKENPAISLKDALDMAQERISKLITIGGSIARNKKDIETTKQEFDKKIAAYKSAIRQQQLVCPHLFLENDFGDNRQADECYVCGEER